MAEKEQPRTDSVSSPPFSPGPGFHKGDVKDFQNSILVFMMLRGVFFLSLLILKREESWGREGGEKE